MVPMAEVYLIRHGETAFDVPPVRMQGWRNTPLNAAGVQESVQLAMKLKGFKPQEIISSDLKRTMQTAIEIKKQCKVPISNSPALRSWNLGELEGKTSTSVAARVKALIQNDGEVVLGGESFRHFVQRFLEKFVPILNKHGVEQPIFVVTHGRNIQLAQAWDKAGRNGMEYDHDYMLGCDEVKPAGYEVMNGE